MAEQWQAAAERVKCLALADGIEVSDRAAQRLSSASDGRPLTPADYASTTGLILRLDGREWVNAPVAEHNPNFVKQPSLVLSADDDGYSLRGQGLSVSAAVWYPPDYHGEYAPNGRPWNDYAYSHGDRVRIAPIGGCAMACRFCNIPYEDPYLVKPLEVLVDALRCALTDPAQPARHALISGGTPRPADVPYLRDVYRTILEAFPEVEIDIMMVPVDGLFDLVELRDRGLNQLSINLELYDEQLARRLMPHKARHGTASYLRFIERATAVLGTGSVRSMLMVGLEDPESTLAGVRAIADAGGVPVLSPFRPDPATPLRALAPPSADLLEAIHREARCIAVSMGTALGPECTVCTHNTLAFAPEDSEPTVPSVRLLE